MIDYRLTVKCSECYTITTYTNERPDWHDWAPDPKEIRKAKRWMQQPREKRQPPVPAYIFGGAFTGYVISVPAPYRYVVCPACDGEALPHEAAETTPDAEQAAS